MDGVGAHGVADGRVDHSVPSQAAAAREAGTDYHQAEVSTARGGASVPGVLVGFVLDLGMAYIEGGTEPLSDQFGSFHGSTRLNG